MRVCQLCILNFSIRSLPVTSKFRFNSRRDIFEPISSGRNFSCFRYRDSLPDIISINYNLIHSYHALAKARKVKDTIEKNSQIFRNFNSISVPIPSFSIVRAASKTNSGEIIDDEWPKKPTNVYN